MRLMLGDCIEMMCEINDNSIDMILADPPYGTTRCKWDSIINLDKLWEQILRVCKDSAAIIMTAQTPFDKILGASNISMLKYEWIWHKTSATGHLNANKAPMKAHENILVFYRKPPVYNPIKTIGHNPVNSYTKKNNSDGECYGATKSISGGGNTDRYPRSVVTFKSDKQKLSLHPTQKPLGLMEYMIKTYSNDGDTILDFCMGSGTTGVAAINLNRNFIGIELNEDYFKIALDRINNSN